jgi:polysaccharide export outer membrane protein
MILNKIVQAAAFIVVTVLFTACTPQKHIDLNYLSRDKTDTSKNIVWQNYEARIQPGDKLSIYVTALNTESAQLYNLATGTGTAVQAQGQGYAVDPEGNILFPQLGFIHVAGETKIDVRDTLLSRLKQYLKDPVVVVDFMNLKVTVLGEVPRQGPININDGKITIFQALGQAGDINLTGRRDSVVVIREKNGIREFGYLNLLSNHVFTSPYFVLQQNDVVYVPMTKAKAALSEEKKVLNFSNIATAVSLLTSLTFLIINITK